LERREPNGPDPVALGISGDKGPVIVRLGREEMLMRSMLLLDLSERLGEAS
jgi:hypothetical protein